MMQEKETNPLAQDSIPIGTVVDYNGVKLEVVNDIHCNGCYFNSTPNCIDENRCTSESNSDGIYRKYVLINEQEEQQMQEKVWKPFTALKDGRTYQDRAGREFTVRYLNIHVTYPFHSKDTMDNNITMCWTAKGEYDLLRGECGYDLILELQE